MVRNANSHHKYLTKTFKQVNAGDFQNLSKKYSIHKFLTSTKSQWANPVAYSRKRGDIKQYIIVLYQVLRI